MLPDSYTIRPAADMDRVAMHEVYNRARASAGCFTDGPGSLNSFVRLLEGEEAFVVVHGDRIAAFLSIWTPDRFIHHLYVDPLDQGRGVGRALLRMCAKKYGPPLSLKCETANLRACRFYERNGWVSGESGVGPDGPWQRYWLESIV